MDNKTANRRDFIKQSTLLGLGMYLSPFVLSSTPHKSFDYPDTEQLLDWTDWKMYRHSVNHPCLTIKEDNLQAAKENIKNYDWARVHFDRIDAIIKQHIGKITPDFLNSMVEETTPGDPLWTPCPSCRDKGLPVHPHGLWSWDVENPEEIQCTECDAVFPNSEYPEEIVLTTTWGKPQKLTYCGGDPFVIFKYKEGRPSFTANIRSRKVQWIAGFCQTLAEGYLLTGNITYAATCREILLRFAKCYPGWLIHVGYGEYADMDPKTAALNMMKLPEPELCPPPNVPDNALWTGFWSAGRASGVGLESDFVRKVVTAYDLTCQAKKSDGRPLYTEKDKYKIEKDLLLESTILLVCDKKLNNKSVSNRTAVALVGMCVGHPGLLRFGLEGFNMTVDGWYLPDGTTSESPFYGLMTLGGIWDMAQAAHGYSDPSGYKDKTGQRIDDLDLYHDSNYKLVWEAFFKGLQGDLKYPPYADSFENTTLDVAYVELMVANYPEKKEYLALLKELCGDDLLLHSGSAGFNSEFTDSEVEPVLRLPYDLTKPNGALSFSMYYRKPKLEKEKGAVLSLPDWCPQNLQIGHLRTGLDGRESLLLLSASPWGIHHENDSLNLYYWKNGASLLSDLGYLWDHPLKPNNIRALAHNTVLIDEENQISKGRGGEILLFKTFPKVKIMEMASTAYSQASVYKRTAVLVDHGNGHSYVVDFFRVQGGEIQDYVFHASSKQLTINGISPVAKAGLTVYDFKDTRTSNGKGTWNSQWISENGMTTRAWSLGQEGEEMFVGDGWGQKDWKNADIGATLPYFVRRKRGEGLQTFVSVFEGFDGEESFVKNVALVDKNGVVEVETSLGKDYIMSMHGNGEMSIEHGKGKEILSGHFAAASVQKEELVWMEALSL
ncbi:hypothetical protein [Cyclobacterium amurskyense]|uniref:hypothetical protein n=1 Tax=Cyclobacterium amurskyense TaxID=320787 RepID=UPI0030D8FAD7